MRFVLVVALIFGLSACARTEEPSGLLAEGQPPPAAPEGGFRLVVLGIAQDGGMPHPGCVRPPCSEVRAGKRAAEKVSCLGLIDRERGDAYLFDATPDFPAQLHALTGGRPPAGIFLTHAHIGHYAGLMYFGKEAMGASGVPVYVTRRMGSFLELNAPWALLVQDNRIALRVIAPNESLELPGGIRVTAILVPHRDELSDTVGYRIEGPRASALFIPDIDKWEKWDQSLADWAEQVDLLFVDGTFSSPEELPGRDLAQVPHPFMRETRELVQGKRARLWFIHMNHSNPALVSGANDIAREGMEFSL